MENKLKLIVRVTDGSSTLRLRVHTMTVKVGCASGPNARYKGNYQEPILDIEFENLAFEIAAPDGESFDGVEAVEVLATILGPVVHGCEIVVAEALEREKEVKDKELQEIGQQAVRMR